MPLQRIDHHTIETTRIVRLLHLSVIMLAISPALSIASTHSPTNGYSHRRYLPPLYQFIPSTNIAFSRNPNRITFLNNATQCVTREDRSTSIQQMLTPAPAPLLRLFNISYPQRGTSPPIKLVAEDVCTTCALAKANL